MDTQTNTQTTTAAPSILEPARLTPAALRNLIEQASNDLLAWLRTNAPEPVFRLATGLNFLEYYTQESIQAGQVEKFSNDYLPIALFDVLNGGAALEQGCLSRSQ